MASTLRRIPELDGMRGLAILMVLVHHFGAPLVPWVPVRTALSGAYGVNLFFVMSGFLITGILLESRGKPNYFKHFYARRSFRIAPIYYLYLAAFFVLLGGPGISPVWYLLFLSNWRDAMLQNTLLRHLWSLAVQEQFYLIWPVVIALVPRSSLKYVCLALVALGTLCIWVAGIYQLRPLVSYHGTIFHIAPLAIGCFLSAVGFKVPSVPILRMSLLRNWGKYSYGAYVWHPFVLMVTVSIVNHVRGGWVRACASIVIGIPATYLVARVSWALIERPALRLRSWMEASGEQYKTDSAYTAASR